MGDNKLETNTILEYLGVKGPKAQAPRRREGIETAVKFLKSCGSSWQDIYGYIEAMDLTKPVRESTLKKDTVVIGYRNRNRPYGLFYTVVGTSSRDVGIDPGGRVFILYRVTSAVDVLESRTRAYKHIYAGSGGGLQYIMSLRYAKQRLEIWRMGDREQIGSH